MHPIQQARECPHPNGFGLAHIITLCSHQIRFGNKAIHSGGKVNHSTQAPT